MNKLFTKVAALTLGVAMAAGVGVALGSANVSEAKASDTVISLDFTTNAYGVSTTQGNQTLTGDGATYGFEFVKNDGSGAKYIDSNTGKYVLFGKTGVVFRNTSAPSNSYISSIGWTYGSGVSENVQIGLSYGASALSQASNEIISFGKATHNGEVSLTQTNTDYSYFYIRVTNNYNCQFKNFTVTWSEKGSAGTYSVSYDANTTNNVGGTVPSSHTGLADGTTQVLSTSGPTRWGYTFGGWAATAESTTPITSVTIDGANATVYAIWTADLTVKGAHASNPYTIAEARTAIDAGEHLKENYVSGKISQIDSFDSDHKSLTYWISDDGTTTNQLQVYSGKGLNGADFAATTDIDLKASVVICGTLKKYNSTYEFDHSNYQVSYVAPVEPSLTLSPNSVTLVMGDEGAEVTATFKNFTETPTVTVEGNPAYVNVTAQGATITVSPKATGSENVTLKATYGSESATATLAVNVYPAHGHKASDPYTVAESLEIIGGLADGGKTENIYVAGFVKSIAEVSTQYKNATYDIQDEGVDNALTVFQGRYENNTDFTSTTKFEVRAAVTVYGPLQKYVKSETTTPEVCKPNYLVSYADPTWLPSEVESFEETLDGFVPPYFGAPSNFKAEDGVASFDLAGDVKSTVDKYFTDNNWVKDGDSYRHVTVGGHGVVEGTAQTSGSTPQVVDKTTVTFTYYHYYVVTVVEGEHSTPTNVPSGDSFKLPSPTESYIPEGKEFKAWSINDQEYDIGHEFEVTAATTVTAVYVDKVQTNWTTEQADQFKAALEGFVPPFMGPLYSGTSIYTDLTEYTAMYYVAGDVSSEFESYVANWEETSGGWYNTFIDQGALWMTFSYVSDYGYTVVQFDLDPGTYYSITFIEGEHSVTYHDIEGASFALPGPSYDAPEGQQFKAWSDGTIEYVAGAQYTLTANVVLTAQYEDKPVEPLTDWTDTQKATFANYLKGGVPPFLGDEFAHGSFSSTGTYTASAEGDFKAAILAKFAGTQWNDEYYAQYGELSLKTTYGYDVVQVSVSEGDNPVTTVKIFYQQTEWTAEQLESFKFVEKLDGFIPPYYPTLVNLQWSDANGAYVFMSTTDYRAQFRPAFQNSSSWTAVSGQTDAYYHYTENGTVYGRLFSQSIQGATYYIVMIYYVADPIPTSLVIDASAVKSDYYVGDELDPTGITAKVLDENGDEIDFGVDITQFLDYDYDFSQPGVVTVTVSIEPKQGVVLTDSFEVNVAAVELTGIEVTGEMSKKSYNDDEEWSTAGLTVYAVYNNGSKVDVTNEATWAFTPEKPEVGVTSVSAVASFGGFDADAVVTSVTVDHIYDANAFAKDLLDKVAPICANYDGKKNNKAALKTVWDTMSQLYSTLSNEEKAKVIAAAAKADGTDLEKAMAFYNYACKKYGLAKFIEGRQVQALVAEHETGNSILPIVVIVTSSVAAITAIGVVIALKRRKALLAK